MRNVSEIELKKEYKGLYSVYDRFWASPDGQIIWDDLCTRFNLTTLRKGPDGRIDQAATVAASGSREVLMYIDGMRNKHGVDG